MFCYLPTLGILHSTEAIIRITPPQLDVFVLNIRPLFVVSFYYASVCTNFSSCFLIVPFHPKGADF